MNEKVSKKKRLLLILLSVLLLQLGCLSNNISRDDILPAGEDFLELGKQAFDEMKFQTAIGYLEKLEDKSADAYYLIGVSYLELHEYETANENFEKALPFAEDDALIKTKAWILLIKGINHHSAAEFKEAVSFSEEAARLFETVGAYPYGMGHTRFFQGRVHMDIGAMGEAQQFLKDALILFEEPGRRSYQAKTCIMLGDIASISGGLEAANEYFQKAYNYMQMIEESDGGFSRKVITADYHYRMGLLAYFAHDMDLALKNYKIALSLYEEEGLFDSMGPVLKDMGSTYQINNQYDKSLEYYQKALENTKKTKDILGEGHCLLYIGNIYKQWGVFDTAADYFKQALAVGRKLGAQTIVANSLMLLGLVSRTLNDSTQALEYFEEALLIQTGMGKQFNIAYLLKYMGQVYCDLGEYESGLDYYTQSLELSRELGSIRHIAENQIAIGDVYYDKNEYEQALVYYNEAFSLFDQMQDQLVLAYILLRKGQIAQRKASFTEAEEYFKEAIAKHEVVRLTANRDDRIHYSDYYNMAYQLLTKTHIQNNNPEAALAAIDTFSSRVFLEQLGYQAGTQSGGFDGIASVQAALSSDAAIISFANSNLNQVVRILTGDDVILGDEINIEDFAREILHSGGAYLTAQVENLRGSTIITLDAQEPLDVSQGSNLQYILEYYRSLISKPVLTVQEEADRIDIAKKIYIHLFGSLEGALHGKTKLIIIPEGILAFLPFETLIMPDGRYMIEQYDIEYTPSLSVAHALKERSYSENRKSFLGFGDVQYRQTGKEMNTLVSQTQLKYLYKQALTAIDENRSLFSIYEALNSTSWKALPHSGDEVRSIDRMLDDGRVFLGADVTESGIKELSRRGELGEYRILHFAAHGIVNPRIPELTSLVLSSEDDGTNDGFLTIGEIADLDIKADLVNISACESGLGRIYWGEGVVGLAQSFFLAGAKGLLLTLWNIDDESTKDFMIDFYNRIINSGESYSAAASEVKRAFIKSDRYNAPFFWAPYVYYGD